MEFGHPWFLALLLIIPIFIFLKLRKKRKPKTIAIPDLAAFKTRNSLLRFFNPFLFWIRLSVLALLILALARPRIADISKTVQKEKGIDIMLTVDTSLSMLTKDLHPDRLTALKGVAEEFVKERLADRIGLISYSGEALTLVPLTMDKNILIQQIENLQTQTLEAGTAIGVGLATAVNHLKGSKAKSKIIILMTDGVNNSGFVDPLTAADIAREKRIKVYTIGIGTNGIAPFPARINLLTKELEFEPQKVEIDEDLLKAIAEKTGGEYFRATNNQSLHDIYVNINKLEKSDINALKYYTYIEEYRKFLLPALLLLLLELFLRGLIRTIN
jgi:Ca-activated chloride channel family protein